MGRPRKQELPPEDVGPELPPEPDELEQAIADLPRDFSVITLYRIPDQGKPRYVTKLTPEEFDLEQIKRMYGGGRFRYVALQAGVQVQKGTFEIEGEPVIAGRKEEASPLAGGLAALGDKLDRLSETMTARPASDMQEKLLTTLIAKLADRQNDGERLLAQLAALRAAGLLGGGGEGAQGSSLLEAVRLVKEGMMLSGGGEGGPVNPFMYAIEKLTPSIEKTVNALTEGKGKPVEKPVPTMPQVSEACRPFVPILKLYLPALITGASMNASAETWADTIEENVQTEQLEAMRTWLHGETWYKDLCTLDRRIALQAAWWGTLRGLLLEPPEGEEPGGGEVEEPEESNA